MYVFNLYQVRSSKYPHNRVIHTHGRTGGNALDTTGTLAAQRCIGNDVDALNYTAGENQFHRLRPQSQIVNATSTISVTAKLIINWFRADGFTPEELRYGGIISIFIRWILIAGALFEINYPAGYQDRYYVLSTLYWLTPGFISGYVYYRFHTQKTVRAPWLLALSAMDFCMVSFSIFVSGGLDSKFHQVYYLVIAMFAVVFTSFRLTLLCATIIAIVYITVCLNAVPGLDLSPHNVKELVSRLVGFYSIGCAVSLISRYERIQRRRAVAREIQTQQERIELSHAIHDTVGQSAYMIGIGIDNAKELAGKSNPQLIASLEATHTLSRSAIWDLRHPIDIGLIFEGRELAPTLASHASTFTAITAIQAQVTQAGTEPPLPTTARSLLFSVAHNAMTNAYRHAEATQVDIVLDFQMDQITIAVSDDGKGLPEDYDQSGHGFRNMQAHAERMGGRLDITSNDNGNGTAVRCSIPIEPEEGGSGIV